MRGQAVRDLLVLEQGGRGGHKEATFLLDPRVAERSENSTFAVCEAVQALGGQAVYEDVVARAGVHIVYPPQVGLGLRLDPKIYTNLKGVKLCKTRYVHGI